MIKPADSSGNMIREAIATTRNNIKSLGDKLTRLNRQEFIRGSNNVFVETRIRSMRSRMLMKYFAIDQEYNLVRSYNFLPGDLLKRLSKKDI